MIRLNFTLNNKYEGRPKKKTAISLQTQATVIKFRAPPLKGVTRSSEESLGNLQRRITFCFLLVSFSMSGLWHVHRFFKIGDFHGHLAADSVNSQGKSCREHATPINLVRKCFFVFLSVIYCSKGDRKRIGQ